MDITPQRTAGRHLRLIVVAVILMAIFGGLAVLCLPYYREKGIAAEIESLGGHIQWAYFGPDWMPVTIVERFPIWNRVVFADFSHTHATDAALKHLNALAKLRSVCLDDAQISNSGLEQLKALTNLFLLDLDNTETTDAGVKHLEGLTSLDTLVLRDTKLTDAGLESLKPLVRLRVLNLDGTQTTQEGRAALSKALPNCDIYPK